MFFWNVRLALIVLSAGGLLAAAATHLAGQAPSAAARNPPTTMVRFRPDFQIGAQWVVETRTLSGQAGERTDAEAAPVQWGFHVAALEPLAGRACYRIEIRCQLPGPRQPQTKLWVDRETRTLRQVQIELPVPGGFRTVTESYEFAAGKPAPVLAPLTALPIDLPIFPEQALHREAKSLEVTEFEAISGPAGAKALGEVSFSIPVEQSVRETPTATVQGLIHAEYQKSIGELPLVEVQLRGAARQVRQLWQAERPWPVYTNNGVTEARLLSYQPATALRPNTPERP